MRHLAVLLAAVVAAGAASDGSPRAAVPAVPGQVFVLAGQSNMLGRGQPLSLASPTSPWLELWREGRWQTASDPLGRPEVLKDGIGPGMTFGLQLVKREPGVTVGLIMCAVGDTAIAEWQPGQAPYEGCVSAVRAAGATVTGLLFLQGENDARTEQTAERWTAAFGRMLSAFRHAVGGAPPCLLGQIGSIPPDTYPAQQLLRDQQARAAAVFAGVRLVRTADLPMHGVHFTVPAYRVIGARFATAWWRMVHRR